MRDSIESKKIIIPELLAPAGTKEAFIAAVEAGADAVYCGGEIFNARMSAGNFTGEEMKKAVDFAHKRGVMVHVTLNTLIEDGDLNEALKYAESLWEMGVDALIIQDLGLASLIKKYIPGFTLHLSTQGSIYDMDGVKAASALGFSRVVLARELSLDEIRNIVSGLKGEAEIEIFCHGALCYCYSGQCQMSRAIGGRSANKGACAQPCRMKYEGSKLTPYPLSPSDLDILDYLPEIVEAGANSIKIEGRMKSPEYVATVVSIYRKYLDILKSKIEERDDILKKDFTKEGEIGIEENTSRKGAWSLRDGFYIEDKDRLSLMQIFNRGFTVGRLTGDQDKKLMSGDAPKNKGLLLGRVKSCTPVLSKKNADNRTGRSKGKEKTRVVADRFLVEGEGISANQLFEISKGDIIEIRSDSGLFDPVSAMVTLVERRGKSLILGDFKSKVSPGEKIYRLQSKVQMEEAEFYYKEKDWDKGKFIRKTSVDLDVVTDGNGMVRISAKKPKLLPGDSTRLLPEGGSILLMEEGDQSLFSKKKGIIKVEGGPFEISETGVDAKARFESSLRKTGGTPFSVGDISYHGDMNLTVPVSEINKMRRRLLDEFERALTFSRPPIEIPHLFTDKEFLSEENLLSEESLPSEDSLLSEGNLFFEEGRLTEDDCLSKKEKAIIEFYFYRTQDAAGFLSSSDNQRTIREYMQVNEEERKFALILPLAELLTKGLEKEISRLKELMASAGISSGRIIPYINNVSKGREEEIIREYLKNNPDDFKERFIKEGMPVYIGSISQAELLKPMVSEGLTLLGDFGLNVYNSATVEELKKLGIVDGIPSLETDGIHFGKYPLMTIEHISDAETLMDKKGRKFKLLSFDCSDQSKLVFDSDELSLSQFLRGIKNPGRKRFYIAY